MKGSPAITDFEIADTFSDTCVSVNTTNYKERNTVQIKKLFVPLLVALSGLANFSGTGQLIAKDKPTKSWGWRGDGSGRFPTANPPVHWSKKSQRMLGLSCQADKPEPGAAKARDDISDGVIREWLVLGPFAIEGEVNKKNACEKFKLAGEADFKPVAGEKSNGCTWKKISWDSSLVESKSVFGQNMKEKAGYFYTNIFSREKAKIYFLVKSSGRCGVQMWVNGKKRNTWWPGCIVELEKGWNRLLIKFVSISKNGQKEKPEQSHQPNFLVLLWGDNSKNDYVTENVIWQTALPQDLNTTRWSNKRFNSAGQPVIAGDKIFATSEPNSLICFDKKTGKILWVRSDGYGNVATPEERKKKTKHFEKIDPLLKRIKAIDAKFGAGTPSKAEILEKAKMESGIATLMFKVNPRKYFKPRAQEGGISCPTPVTDGKQIYVYYGGTGIIACYDFDGNRQWIHHIPSAAAHHAYSTSPVIINGKVFTMSAENGKDRTRTITAYDCQTGKIVWQKGGVLATPSGSFLKINLKGKTLLAESQTGIRDPETGDIIIPTMTKCDRPTPIFYDNKLLFGGHAWNRWSQNPFTIFDFNGASLEKAKKIQIPFTGEYTYTNYKSRTWDSLAFIASPLYHDGLLYFYRNDGLLVVADAKTASIVYMKDLHTNYWADGQRGGDTASLTLAGKYIYYFDVSGTCIVFKPGRKYGEVARNKIEQANINGYINNFKSSPIFEGDRMYFKAEDHLYCIGEK